MRYSVKNMAKVMRDITQLMSNMIATHMRNPVRETHTLKYCNKIGH